MNRAAATFAEPDLDRAGDDRMLGFNLELSARTNEKLDRMAGEIGITKGELFAWSLALLEIAVNARKEGKSIAIVDADRSIERIISLELS
jgi:hypothetical protein